MHNDRAAIIIHRRLRRDRLHRHLMIAAIVFATLTPLFTPSRASASPLDLGFWREFWDWLNGNPPPPPPPPPPPIKPCKTKTVIATSDG